jgi:hypothetical protein
MSHNPQHSDVIATGRRALVAQLGERIGPELATELVEWLVAFHDRLLFAEAALHHIAERIGLNLGTMPTPPSSQEGA